MVSFDHRYDSGNYLRCVVAVPRAQSRIDGERVDTGGRAFNHILSRCVESSRRPRSIAGLALESSIKGSRPAHGPQRERREGAPAPW